MLYGLCIFSPLVGAAIAGLLGRILGAKGSQVITCGTMTLSLLFALIIFKLVALENTPQTVQLFSWIISGSFQVDWALRFDTLTAVMLVVVTGVSTLVHYYSIGYMHHDPHNPRFFSYLSLFTFFMLMLVTSDNFLQLFFGWEGVGLASYLLIGFWYKKPSANSAAIKAFLVNRVGDFGFALGIMGVFLVYGTLSFDAVFDATPGKAGAMIEFLGGQYHAITVLCLLLFIGAMGKSAQLGLHTWLPDAMEGPTPVSALIHAATMVTAGVFMVARLSPMFEYSETALAVVTVVGASTAFFAATVGLCQNDIKRVIAYSTCSQLGYMFFACGVSAYAAGIFHLFTHAFFKALLFLGAGSVIHAMSDEQDMRKMGGIWRQIKTTYIMMWIGSLALAGVPLFSGFYSKDIVLEASYAAQTGVGNYAFILGMAAALMTAFYSWRLLIMTFHGESRADEKTLAHVHESPKIMTVPLGFLALGAVFAGWLGFDLFVGSGMKSFWGEAIFVLDSHTALKEAHGVPLWVKIGPVVMGGIGIALAYWFYMFNPKIPAALAQRFSHLYRFLLNKWYFDELYDRVLVQPSKNLGKSLWKDGDGTLIDGLGPDGIAGAIRYLAQRASALQSGYIFHYAFAMLIGVAILVSLYLFGIGH
ncbi:MAG: NADH-quinone oxidoreductase subunit L [Rhodospirillaceae bacterium]